MSKQESVRTIARPPTPPDRSGPADSPATGPVHSDAQARLTPSLTKVAHARPPRIVLFSHDTMGLGHARRNLTIARTLAGADIRANVLMITGTNVAAGLTMPRGVDCLTLPAIHKSSDRQFTPRSMNLPMDVLTDIRSRAICGAVEAFDPDILIVDNVPRGARGELDATLTLLRRRGGTRCVLGLRDVIDSPELVAAEWQQRANAAWIESCFDAVWVYGDPNVYDPVQEYALSDAVASRLHYTGYLERSLSALADAACGSAPAGIELPLDEMLLCMAGGGQDGAQLARAVCEATLPPGMSAVVLTGPCMPENMKHRLASHAATKPNLQVLEFHPEPMQLLRHADHVISMGGYNSVSEILSLEKRALIVPRVAPRREQLIRAERLAALDLLDLLHPEQLTPAAIGRWLDRPAAPRTRASDVLDFDGLSRLQQLTRELLAGLDLDLQCGATP